MSRDEHSAHRPPPSIWPSRLAQSCAIAVAIAVLAVGRLLLVPHVVVWASRTTNGSATSMTVIGWATAAFAPAAALVLLLDYQRRERQLDEDPLDGPRAFHDRATAGYGGAYWVRRLPLILALLVATVFAPTRSLSGPSDWVVTPGGDAFRRGWNISFLFSLMALIALLVFWILALVPGRGDRVLRVAGPLVAGAAPTLGLLVLYASTH